MEKLLAALTEVILEYKALVKAQREHTESLTQTQRKINTLPAIILNDSSTATTAGETEKPKNKGGRPRKETSLSDAHPKLVAALTAQTSDPLAPQAPAVAPSTPAPALPATEITEAQSKAELDAAAEAYVKKFSELEAGLKAARKIMAEEFKVGKIADLKHLDRIACAKRFREEAGKF